MKNRYFKNSKLSEAKFREILRYFALDLTATECAALSHISVRSINNIYLKIRQRMVIICQQNSPLKGDLEADESYFGARRVRGKRGRGASGKTIVFGLLKRNGNIYTEIIPNASRASLQAIIRGRADINSVIHTDGWRGYDGLVDIGFDKHFRVNHGADEFAIGSNHVNGIESFWSYAKRRMVQFNGVHKHTFLLHLKETEFRFNNRKINIYKTLLVMLRNDPL
jgi:transposase-like protein